MIGLYWFGNMLIVFIELVLALLLLRNYYSMRKTKIGKRLFGVAVVFLLQSILSMVFFASWASMGFGKIIAGPLLLLSLCGLIGVSLLYSISEI